MSEQKEKAVSILIEYPSGFDMVEVFRKEEIKALGVSEIIKLTIKFGMPDQIHIVFQLILAFISSLATEDPTKIHFDIVRAAIKKIDPALLADKDIIYMTVKNFIDFCTTFKLKIIEAIPEQILEQINNTNKQAQAEEFEPDSGRKPLEFKITNLNTIPNLDKIFVKGETCIWDKLFLDVLKHTGKNGATVAKELKDACCEKFNLFKTKNKSPLTFWFNTESPTPETPFHVSPALQILAGCIYEDIIKKTINFRDNNPEGLTTNVCTAITKMALAPVEGKLKKNARSIQLYDNHKLIGSIDIAMIPSTLIKCVWEGVAEFDSLTAIRLLRLLIKQTYEEKIRGNTDFRILRFPGAAKEIAEALNLKNKHEVTKIKNLLNAWNHFTFSGPIASRLLNLGICKAKSKYSHQKGYEITVLSPLLPYRIYEENGGFIIPLLREPPLIGHRSYHAKLFILQWKIAEEFVKQSVHLSDYSFIIIDQKKWLELANFCNIPEKMIPIIQESWTGPDGFLKQIDISNGYTLKNEDKALMFLKEQGRRRSIQSKRGQISAEKRCLKKPKSRK